jgi:hypothetical protein
MGNECRFVEECGRRKDDVRMASWGGKPEKGDNKEYGGLMGVKADKLKLSLCPSPDVITTFERNQWWK